MLRTSTAMLSTMFHSGRPDMFSIRPHGPVPASISLPAARMIVTAAPTWNPLPKMASRSRGNTTSATKAGRDSRRIQLVAAA